MHQMGGVKVEQEESCVSEVGTRETWRWSREDATTLLVKCLLHIAWLLAFLPSRIIVHQRAHIYSSIVRQHLR